MSQQKTTRSIRCDGALRRDVLRMGVLSGLGFSLLSNGLARPIAAQFPRTPKKAAKSCILIWLDGGPSHLDMFDPKPRASAEIRGPFSAIPTTVTGVEISELLPRTAELAEHLAIVRSMTSPLGEHGLANHYLLTGYQPTPVLEYPSLGAVVAKQFPGNGALPPHIAVPHHGAIGAGFLGARFEPWSIQGDPAKADFQVQDLTAFPEVDVARLHRRAEFLREFDQRQRQRDQAAAGNSPMAQALELATSAAAQAAFDLRQESENVRQRYGPRTFGQSCLLARRLVERDVRFVTVNYSGWDTHSSLALNLQQGYAGAKVGVGLVPTLDQGFSALISDLVERRMLDDTLVIVMGEFGRTPKINAAGGRDHWPRVFSVVLAGGGVPGGQVIGSSDAIGESPRDQPYSPNDLARTIYTLLGIDPDTELMTPSGRPVTINRDGQLIRQLI